MLQTKACGIEAPTCALYFTELKRVQNELNEKLNRLEEILGKEELAIPTARLDKLRKEREDLEESALNPPPDKDLEWSELLQALKSLLARTRTLHKDVGEWVKAGTRA